jgi:hypothetical protein
LEGDVAFQVDGSGKVLPRRDMNHSPLWSLLDGFIESLRVQGLTIALHPIIGYFHHRSLFLLRGLLATSKEP